MFPPTALVFAVKHLMAEVVNPIVLRGQGEQGGKEFCQSGLAKFLQVTVVIRAEGSFTQSLHPIVLNFWVLQVLHAPINPERTGLTVRSRWAINRTVLQDVITKMRPSDRVDIV